MRTGGLKLSDNYRWHVLWGRLEADGYKTLTVHQAAGQSEQTRLVSLAEAAARERVGLAEAVGMRRKAEVYNQYNDAAKLWQVCRVLPQIAGK